MKRVIVLTIVLSMLFSLCSFASVSADSIYADFSQSEYQSDSYINATWAVEDQSNGQLYVNDENKFFGIENDALRVFPTAQEIRFRYLPSFTLRRGATYEVKVAASRARYTSASYRMGLELLGNETVTLVDENGESFTNQHPYAQESDKGQPIWIDSNSLNSWNLGNASGLASENWQGTENSPMSFTFTVQDLKNSDGTSISSTSNLKLYFAMTGTYAESNKYPDRRTGLSLISIKETLPENPDPDPEPAEDYSIKTTVINENFDSGTPFANWSEPYNGTEATTRSLDNGAMLIAPVTNQLRVRYQKTVVLKKDAAYILRYKIKGSSALSWLFGIETAGKWKKDAGSSLGSAMYDSSIRKTSTDGDGWTTVTTAFQVLDLQDAAGNPLEETNTAAIFFLFTNNVEQVRIDDIELIQAVQPQKPFVSNVRISGGAMEGGTVSSEYLMNDPDKISADVSFLWEISDDGQSGWTKAGEEQSFSIAQEGMAGKYLRLGVTPVSPAHQDTETVYSSPVKILQNRPLPGAEDVTLISENGGYRVTYTYQSNGYEEGNTRFVWQYLGEDRWVTIGGADQQTYILSGLGAGKQLRAGVIPADEDGVEGSVVYTNGNERLPNQITLYVSPDGNEDGDGTEQSPFATIGQARDRLRLLKQQGALEGNDVTVYLREGEYYGGESFTAQDSGTEEHPIIYSAYPGERVVLTGGKHVDSADIAKVTSGDIYDRVLSKDAKGKLFKIDLSNYYASLPEPKNYSHANDAAGTGESTFKDVLKIVVNGKTLENAVWPNEDSAELEITEVIDDENGGYISAFADTTNRMKLWSRDALKDLRVVGHLNGNATWTYQDYKVSAIDPENNTFSLQDITNHQPALNKTHEPMFRFYNIPEEIDQPGECYIDRDNKAVYFYAYGDQKDFDVVVPVYQNALIQVSGAQQIQFRNLNLEHVRAGLFSVGGGADNIVFDGCSFLHFTQKNSVNGTNNVIRNCYFNDGGVGGVVLNGGNVSSLTPGNNVLENSVLTHCGTLKRAYGPAVQLGGVGQIVRNNEIAYSDGALITLGNPDHVITGNEIHHGVQWTGDMGAVYWGRSLLSTGVEITNNYFHHNGSEYANGWAQSIFCDDGGIGPKVTGNVFYQASLPEARGGTTYPIKTHGGQYMDVSNNIFIDVPYAVQFQTWGTTTKYQELRWWMFLYDKDYNNGKPGGTGTLGFWNAVSTNGLLEDTWKEHYKGTQWEPFLQLISKQHYDLLSPLNCAVEADYQKIVEYAKTYAPSYTNTFYNNVMVGTKNGNSSMYPNGSGKEKNSYFATAQKGREMFADYGKDFTLTDQALTEIRKTAPDFQKVDFGAMGTAFYGNGQVVGGRAPKAEQVMLISGSTGGRLMVKYSFSSLENRKESVSQINWYVSHDRNGEFTLIQGQHDTTLSVESAQNSYLYCEVTPVDDAGRTGETVRSETVQVSKASSLEEQLASQIEQSEALHEAVKEGNDFGHASAQAKSSFEEAIVQAKEAKGGNEDELYQALNQLIAAQTAFQSSVNQEVPAEIADGTELLIYGFMTDKTFTLDQNSTGVILTLPAGEELPEIMVNGYVTVDGIKQKAVLAIPKGVKITGAGCVTVNLFGESGQPGVTINGENIIALKLTDNQITLNVPVSLTIENAWKKLAAFANGSKGDTISTSSLASKGYGREKVNQNDLRVTTTKLGEIILYSAANLPSPSPIVTPAPGNEGNSGTAITTPGSSIGGTAVNRPSESPAAKPQSEFGDIAGHWAEGDINEMVRQGIVSGVTETAFEPDRSITRAEFATLISKALKLNSQALTNFEDVAEQAWYAPYVNAAANAGLITGYEGYFRPDDTITREEMAVIIVKADLFLERHLKTGKIDQFSDREQISSWALDYADKSVSSGLISGITANIFAPKENATRAQAVSLIKRLLEKTE